MNGMHFDNEGNLYVNAGSQTNAGWPESHLTGGLLKIEVHNPNLSRKIEYVYHKTREPVENPNQVEGDRYDLADGMTGISIWATGLRNNYDSTYSTKGETYIIMNGPNQPLGPFVNGEPRGTGCTAADFDTWDEIPQYNVRNPLYLPKPYTVPNGEQPKECQPVIGPAFSGPDRIFRSFEGAHHGHPNPARARNAGDEKQWYHHVLRPDIEYTPGWEIPSSTTGVTEYRGTCFGGKLRDDILVSRWRDAVYFLDLPDNENADETVEVLTSDTGGQNLDIMYGPACSIVLISFLKDELTIITPDEASLDKFEADEAAMGDPVLYDILPWRGPARYDVPFTLGGRRFTSNGREPVRVSVGGVEAEVAAYDDTRIEGVMGEGQKNDKPAGKLLDIRVIFSDHSQALLPAAFMFLEAPTGRQKEEGRQKKDGKYDEKGDEDRDETVRCFIEENLDYAPGADLEVATHGYPSYLDCADWCAATEECNYWVHVGLGDDGMCFLKSDREPVVGKAPKAGDGWKIMAGNKSCGHAAGADVNSGKKPLGKSKRPRPLQGLQGFCKSWPILCAKLPG
ncbi:unnamed protein product [Vitrella brassicaformis CCMP3155]|uniref:Apple domain-containing protein n=2 Tax=Vitrella brassicaformis TaxID=1169539 RepID=A0A0G4GAX4_VITBC|nr:unnamed protein product [Vitrella brassicaformis CCMP3155]|eukprot:CEM25960.1 unnamed protein product [Vitrella brassicaformis CCMP3155]